MPPENKNKPNPEWVTAPYEVGGMSDLPGLKSSIELALKLTKGGPLEIHISTAGVFYDDSMLMWRIRQMTEEELSQ